MGIAVISKLDHYVTAMHFLGNSAGCSGASKAIKHNVAGVAA